MRIKNTIINKSRDLKFLLGIVFLLLCTVFFLYIKALPKKIVEFNNLKLGMTMQEVLYILGEPTFLLSDLPKDAVGFNKDPEVIPTNKLNSSVIPAEVDTSVKKHNKESSKVTDYISWAYNVQKNLRVDVEFSPRDKKVISIGCYVNTDDYVIPESCKVNNIKALDSEATVRTNLGNPSQEKFIDYVKVLTYKNLNMEIFLGKQKVYMIVIKDKS